jgi:hypothetical protein
METFTEKQKKYLKKFWFIFILFPILLLIPLFLFITNGLNLKKKSVLIPFSFIVIIVMLTLTYCGHVVYLNFKLQNLYDRWNEKYAQDETKSDTASHSNIFMDSLSHLKNIQAEKEEILQLSVTVEYVVDQMFEFNKDTVNYSGLTNRHDFLNFTDFRYSYYSDNSPSILHGYVKGYKERDVYYKEDPAYPNYKGIIETLKQYIDDRSPENIINLFNLAKYTIYNLISKATYERTKLNLHVDYLIETYNAITSVEGYEHHLNHLYILLSNKDTVVSTEDTYNELHPIMCKRLDKLSQRDESPINQDDLVWLHTFWMRRYKDGNVDEVYHILREIQNHYSKI